MRWNRSEKTTWARSAQGGSAAPAEASVDAQPGAARNAHGGESGMGFGFRQRRDRRRKTAARVECDRRLHAGVPGTADRYQLYEPPRDARAGSSDRSAGHAPGSAERQRSGTHQPPLSGVVCGAPDRYDSHPAWEAHAEWARRELSREATRRMLECELVLEPVGRAAQ